MIKFFRKIRYDLLEKRKSGKYLKYAIGEIVLVMIGILLALQVNEWNNERNRKKSEQVIIEQLITDLSQSQYELESEISFNLSMAREYSQVLRAFWKSKLPDDIETYVRGGGASKVYSPVMGTAKSLINSGKLDIISSKELKNDIVTYIAEVDYSLKDINRYEESYYRPGVALLKDAIPSSYRSIDAINGRDRSEGWKRSYNMNLNNPPKYVEKVPFKADLNELFENQNFYSANSKLLTYHRNISFRYYEILSRTNELLLELYLASDKYQGLDKKLNESSYYLVFDTEDLEILKRAYALLSESSKWSKNHGNDCNNDNAAGIYSLGCSLRAASIEVVGKWEDYPNSSAVRLIRLKLQQDGNRRYVKRVVREWNNHPDTTFEDVKNLLEECIEEVKKQLE